MLKKLKNMILLFTETNRMPMFLGEMKRDMRFHAENPKDSKNCRMSAAKQME